MGYFLAGLISIIFGVVLLFKRKKNLSHITKISFAGMDTIEDIVEQIKYVTQEIEAPQAMKKIIEFNGKVSNEMILTSELSKKNCVFYNVKIDERYEETYYLPKKGRRERHTRIGTKTIRNENYWTVFYVSNDKMKIKIDPTNCKEIDLVLSYSQYEPYRKSSGRDYKILGYQYTEKLLPVNSNVYVIGEISYDGQEFCIKKPGDTSAPFIISLKSKEEILKQKQSNALLSLIGAIALFLLGIILIIYGIASPANY